jgi:hypothetical protein
MPGPLPDPDAERRNAPTIPTTKLPAGGRRGPIPDPPEWIPLGLAEMLWWRWAWRTPQACAWDDGQLVKVAHRARLEDTLAALSHADEFDTFLHEVGAAEELREIKAIVGRLAGLVTNELGIIQKASDLDDRLGLSPKGRDQMRMKIVADSDYYPSAPAAAGAKSDPAKVSKLDERRARRERSVDAS